MVVRYKSNVYVTHHYDVHVLNANKLYVYYTCIAKVSPFKFKLSATYCSNLTAPIALK